MVSISRSQIYETLDHIEIPGLGLSPIKVKGVRGLDINENGNIHVNFELPSQASGNESEFEARVKKTLMQVEGVTAVDVTIKVLEKAYGQIQQQNLLPTVKYPVLVGSGKGGVGKSTVTANLAITLAKKGYRVGLMDGDLYGPSIPLMFGINERPFGNDDGKIIPFEKFGVKLISIGFMLDDNAPVIWRGPILHKAIQQFMQDVDWGELDYLLIDLPPGTGDVQLSIAQSAKVAGAIAVTTPQDVALADVKKAVGMFQTLQVPLWGVVENMSYFKCTQCDTVHHIFGGSDGKSLTGERLGTAILAELPLTVAVREGGDNGQPIVVQEPDSDVARIFSELAQRIAECVQS